MRASRTMAVVLTLVVLAPNFVRADETRAPDPWRFSVRRDVESILSIRPLHFVAIGTVLAGAAAAVEDPADQKRSLEDWHDVTEFGNVYGSPVTVFAGAAVLGGVGRLAKRRTLEAASIDLGRSCAYSSALVGGLKVLVDRRRPDGGRQSFPSGHAAAAFSAAPVLAHHFGPWIGAAGYTLAVITVLGRMESERHYLSDVVFGGALGYAVGEAIVTRRIRSDLEPVIDKERLGVRIRF